MPSIRRTWIFYGLLCPLLAMADRAPVHSGVGAVAVNLMEPVTILANFIGTMSIVIGLSFLLATFVKYMQYRVNPLAVPISTVVILLIMAVILLCIPFLYKLTDTGIPISL